MQLNVTQAGFLTTIQDIGRVGFRQFGVSSGGALDLHAMRIANLLVGNDETAAGLEITQGNIRLRFDDDRVISWCGGHYQVCAGSSSISAGHPTLVSAPDELSISGPQRGCRAWLAISGGITVPRVLGSRSTDRRANFGGLDGRALRDGDVLPLGRNSASTNARLDVLRAERIAQWSAPEPWSQTANATPVLRIVRGADWSRFNETAHQVLTSEKFEVTSDSDRMGLRLGGPELRQTDELELVSEAVAPGTIQVPPNGRPILLLGDCQTIGGYPKIAHVITVDLSVAAQLRAGDHVSFSEVSIADAHRLLLQREHDVERFRIGLSLHDS